MKLTQEIENFDYFSNLKFNDSLSTFKKQFFFYQISFTIVNILHYMKKYQYFIKVNFLLLKKMETQKKFETDWRQDSNQEQQSFIKNEHKSKKQITKQKNEEDLDQELRRNLLTAANPIIGRQKQGDQKISIKFFDSERQSNIKKRSYRQISLKKCKQIDDEIQEQLDMMTLFNSYEARNLLYRKHDNSQCSQLNTKKYFASIFTPIYSNKNQRFKFQPSLLPFQGIKKEILPDTQDLIFDLETQLDFNSNFQSGNLFAVYKTAQFSYDLILQNDINTIGCTQWFYFSVKNKKNKDITVHFNIVNLYKTSSLYNKGMKLMVFSTLGGKEWKRKGQNIFYHKNAIRREGQNKCYCTLSFSYNFDKENDTVDFAHAVPYTYSRMLQLIKKVESSKKCEVKSLGMTPLKKVVPIIKFESQDRNLQRKALIIMARQHPGEVQGSFAIQQIILNFLKSSTEIEFLLYRFNVYIIPMINVDGVFLGNYRCNAMGYDLNRNWEGQQKSKHPEVFFIKNQIKKIMSKQQIELILDLHGHSNKMNSFFYGNPFGPNPYLFPYAASTVCPFVDFSSCSFKIENKQKAKTARSVLGNMIKQTGNVYTYQMSFYGGTKNGKVINFYQQNFKQLGKQLLTSIFKVYVESYKQQKTLKQSLYLKDLRRQIKKTEHQIQNKSNSDSDSEAENDRRLISQQRKKYSNQKSKSFKLQNISLEISSSNQNLIYNQTLFQKKQQSLLNSPQAFNCVGNKNITIQTTDPFFIAFKNNVNFKQKLIQPKSQSQKVQIFGQNILPKSTIHKQTEEVGKKQLTERGFKMSSEFQNRMKQVMRLKRKTDARNYRDLTKNSITLLPQRKQMGRDQGILNRMEVQRYLSVRVNQNGYKSIQRDESKLKTHKYAEQRYSNCGIFRLPSIIKNFKA